MAAVKAKQPKGLPALLRESPGAPRPDGIWKPLSMFWVSPPNWEETLPESSDSQPETLQFNKKSLSSGPPNLIVENRDRDLY